MKPDAAVSAGDDESSPDIDPCDLFVSLGMLILESRLPTPSVKGRRDGPHCPPALGLQWASHSCDLGKSQCERVARIQKQMQMLWRNHIPMCIEVLLFSSCRHGQTRAASMDIAPPDVSDSCVLLEQWTIQSVARKSSEHCVSARSLFQAIRSHLHFSQLSAWLNATHGMAPQCIGYRVSPPGEFCTSRFSVTPEHHTFPVSSLGKSASLRTTVQLLPRLSEIPNPVCHESHDLDGLLLASHGHSRRCSGFNEHTRSAGRLKSPDPVRAEVSRRSTSPRFTKKNVQNHESSAEYAEEKGSCRCPCTDCRTHLTHQHCALSGTESKVRSTLILPQDPGDCVCSTASSLSARNELGAIPKHPDSLVPDNYPSSANRSAETFPDEGNDSELEDCSVVTSSSLHNKKQLEVVNGQSSSVATERKPNFLDVVPLGVCKKYSMSARETGTDSSSSSPDIDRILTKTLMTSRCEPLSPQEMEVYLSSLYRRHRRKTKSTSSYSGLDNSDRVVSNLKSVCEANVVDRQLKSIAVKLKGHCEEDGEAFPYKNVAYCTPSGNQFAFLEAKLKLSKLLRNEIRKSDARIDRDSEAMPEALAFLEKTDAANEADDSIFSCGNVCDSDFVSRKSIPDREDSRGELAQASHRASRRLFDPDPSEEQPLFIVGSSSSSNGFSVSDAVACRTGDGNGLSGVAAFPEQQKQEEAVCVQTESNLAMHKSVSCPSKKSFSTFHKAGSLLKNVMKKDLCSATMPSISDSRPVPTPQETVAFRNSMQKSASMVFHASTRLPLQSSPAPIKRLSSSGTFDYDNSLTNVRAITNSFSCVNLSNSEIEKENTVRRTYSTSAPASTNCLLGNFEESMLNGRIEPSGVVEGFSVDISASGSFCPKHVSLPVTAFFFSLSEDNAPSPYLGHISLDALPKRGYHVPKKGTVQVTLFNPNKSVVKIFVVVYDLSDMPPNSQTFLRQRTLYMPVKGGPSDKPNVMVYLRYLIHLRFASSKSGKIYLHTDIRVIFARDKFELDSRVANYELRSFTDTPTNPKYSPKR